MVTVLLALGGQADLLHVKSMISWADHGYQVASEARNLEDAHASFEQLSPDIVLADLGLPGGGAELARRIRGGLSWASIVFLSDSRNFDDARLALELSADGFLVKSELGAELLLKTLSRCGRQARKNFQVSSILKREFMRKAVLENVFPNPPDGLMPCFSNDRHCRFLFFLIQHDLPLCTVWNEAEPMPSSAALTDEFFQSLPAVGDSAFICSLYLSPAVCGVLYKLTRHISQRCQTEIIYRHASAICQAYGAGPGREPGPDPACGPLSGPRPDAAAGRALSVVSVGPFDRIEELGGLVVKRSPLLQLAYYGWRGKLIEPVRAISFGRRPFGFLDETVERFQAAIGKDTGECRRLLQILFGHTDQECIPVDEINYICAGLASACKKALPENFLSKAREDAGPEWLPKGAALDVKKLHYWYATLCESALEHMERVRQAAHSGKLLKILSYIDEHHHRDLSINDVAAAFSLSSDYFRHYIKKEAGLSFVDYLTHVRIEHSKRLLRSGECKISEIARRVGFHTSQYYSLVFRKHTDVTPSQYAEKYRYLGHGAGG